jgi:hypothetical protein
VVVLSATLIAIEGISAIAYLSAHGQAQTNQRQPTAEESRSAFTAPISWRKVDAGAFSIFAPLGWEFHQLQGIDSFVGEFVGDGVVLTFDFGQYSNPFNDAKQPVYVIAHENIGGFRAKIVRPRTPGHGVTGVYFHNVGDSNRLCLWGKDLTSMQQELAVKIFETIRFGGAVPPYVVPPPPPPPKNEAVATLIE